MVATSSTKAVTSIASTTTIPSTAQEGVIFSPSITQGHPMTHGLTMESDFRPHATSFTMHMPGREQPYRMPTLMMTSLQTNFLTFTDNKKTPYSPLLESASSINHLGRTMQPQLGMWFISQVMPIFTTNYVMTMRWKIEESNHKMVNLLTRQMDTIFNHLIQNTNHSYQQLATITTRIVDFFGTPRHKFDQLYNPRWVG